jgi:hypothetical protein
MLKAGTLKSCSATPNFQHDRLPSLAADLVRRGVAVIVATGGAPVLAAPSVSRLDFEAGGLSIMQRESCGMDVAKRGVFTFCAFSDFNDLGVAKRAQTQLLREPRSSIRISKPISGQT